MEINWQIPNKVEALKEFKHRIEIIFMAHEVLKERQYALIIVVADD